MIKTIYKILFISAVIVFGACIIYLTQIWGGYDDRTNWRSYWITWWFH